MTLSVKIADHWKDLIILLVLVYAAYFLFVRKKYKYYKLKKNGLKLPAKVLSINETNIFIDYESYMIPVMEIVFELEYPPNLIRKETIRHEFSRYENVPKIGDIIIIIVDKTNPNNFDLFKE
ncbi:hypothetical protein DJ568_04190 [Mucilaginibacter hurinus]|uniref:DUF3592 domain-containing protein n=1 Tax=Mucilaginibacter hurinus TaxID=2201324 RepID=A0A367GR65_9SPHI|nr:hypothetical protein [Mucilaginibacter hurinus]RCH55959.1 hypothetical protein DJ568_04190 [Mucilaginibacter hurinus]